MAAMCQTDTTGPCRYCGVMSYGGDDEGPAHDCCWAWRKVIAAGHRCPACQIAGYVMSQSAYLSERTGNPRQVRLPVHPPPLPMTLPDGSPFVPEIENSTNATKAAHLRLVT
jgi:hypothetical protein